MRYSTAALFLLPAVLAQSPTTDAPLTETGNFAFGEPFSDNAAYSSYLVQSEGFKPQVASYFIGLETNSVVESAFQEFYSVDFDYVRTGADATATGPVAELKFLEAQVTGVADANARAILSSAYNEALAIQTAAAAPTDLALSAGIAGVVAAAAGLAVAL